MSNEDPWRHRSAGLRCGSCCWFIAKAPRVDFGRCRRHAPTMSGFPAVFAADWCGDHKLDENKMPEVEKLTIGVREKPL